MPYTGISGRNLSILSLALGALFLTGCSQKASPPPATRGNAAPATRITDGKILYDQHCAFCHGSGGQGGSGPALKGESVGDTIIVVTNGERAMPSFKGKLTEEQIRAVAGYVAKWK